MLVVVFRGCPTNDPEDGTGVTCSFSFKHFPARRKYLGTGVMDGNGAKTNPFRYRYLIEAESAPIPRSSSLLQIDYGRLSFFEEQVLTSQYLFIYRVYEGLIGSLPALRADYDRDRLDTITTQNDFWYAKSATGDGYPADAVQGKLPMWVQWEPPEIAYAGGGNYVMTINLLSNEVFGGS